MSPGRSYFGRGYHLEVQRFATDTDVLTKMDFSKYSRVSLKGGLDDVDAFENVGDEDKAECVVPQSGEVYRALRLDNDENIADELLAAHRATPLPTEVLDSIRLFDYPEIRVSGCSIQKVGSRGNHNNGCEDTFSDHHP